MKKKRFHLSVVLFGVLLAISSGAQTDLPKPGKYSIVKQGSKIEIKTGTAGVLGFAGHGHTIHATAFSGEVDITSVEQHTATVSVHVQAASLREVADFDAKEKTEIESQLHGPVLETAKFPEITFQGKTVKLSEGAGKVYDGQIQGSLVLHGVTRNITVPVRITIDGDSLRATGNFEVNRPDYQIETKSAGGGTVKVAKTLEISYVFRLKPQ